MLFFKSCYFLKNLLYKKALPTQVFITDSCFNRDLMEAVDADFCRGLSAHNLRGVNRKCDASGTERLFCSQLDAAGEFWWPASSSVSLLLLVLRHDEHSESASRVPRHPGGKRVLTEVYPWLNLLNTSCLLRRAAAPPPPTPC